MNDKTKPGFSNEFIAGKLVENIKSTRSLLDKLNLILLSLTVLGNFKGDIDKSKVFEYIGLVIPLNFFEIFLVLSLISVFGIIGSLLIDYVQNRTTLDNIWVKETHNLTENDRLIQFPIPASIYEYVYRIGKVSVKKATSQLWLPVGIILLSFFFVSHYTAIVSIWEYESYLPFRIIWVLGILLVYILLYRTFIFSVKENNEYLGKVLLKCILLIFSGFILKIFYFFITH